MNAAERIVMRIAIEPPGFLSERELDRSQLGVARRMARNGLLRRAGQEPDGTKVYQPTEQGRTQFAKTSR